MYTFPINLTLVLTVETSVIQTFTTGRNVILNAHQVFWIVVLRIIQALKKVICNKLWYLSNKIIIIIIIIIIIMRSSRRKGYLPVVISKCKNLGHRLQIIAKLRFIWIFRQRYLKKYVFLNNLVYIEIVFEFNHIKWHLNFSKKAITWTRFLAGYQVFSIF